MGGWERDINLQKSKLERTGLWIVTLSREMRDKGLQLARDAVSKNRKHEALILPSGCKYCVCVCLLRVFSGMSCVFCHSIKPTEIVQSCEQKQNDSS